MPAVLFAVRTVWVAILFVIIGLSLISLSFRVVVDFGRWFKEEIIDDIADSRRKARARREAEKAAEEDV